MRAEEPSDSAPVTCTACGACCVAPDIAALDKPLGQACVHLLADNLCAIYDARPDICRAYAADSFCTRIAAPTLDERVHNYLAAYGLLEEAARLRGTGHTGMRAARGLPVLQPGRATPSPLR